MSSQKNLDFSRCCLFNCNEKSTQEVVQNSNRVAPNRNVHAQENHLLDNVNDEVDSVEALMSMKLSKRINIIMKWAKQLNLARYEGSSNDLCYKCLSGGNLMCCEFCNSVVHLKCCDPPLHKVPNYDWV